MYINLPTFVFGRGFAPDSTMDLTMVTQNISIRPKSEVVEWTLQHDTIYAHGRGPHGRGGEGRGGEVVKGMENAGNAS